MMFRDEPELLSVEGLMNRTKAALPTAGVRDGAMAWCSDGRKSGEGAGSGTGVLAYFNSADSTWRVFSADTEVAT